MDLQLTTTALIPSSYSLTLRMNHPRSNLPNLAEYIDMDSHHPEGAALFSALCFVCLLLTKYPRGPITGVVPKLQFVLDNKSIAEDHLEWTYRQETSVFDYLKSDYDILQGIQREIKTLPIASKVSWVKGHQDQYKQRMELSLDEGQLHRRRRLYRNSPLTSKRSGMTS
jgi:hypothetical protein